MSKVNPVRARGMLSDACEHYTTHKKRQLEKLMAKSHLIPKFVFFQKALGNRDEPHPGFHDWVRCKYYELLDYIFSISRSFEYVEPKYTIYEYMYGERKFNKYYPYGRLKSFDERDWTLNQYEPSLVLYNLKSLLSLLDAMMKDVDCHYIKLKEESSYQESDYACPDDTIVTLQIRSALEQLTTLTNFISNLPAYKNNKGIYCVCQSLNDAHPIFEDYFKWSTVHELKSILDNTALSDEDAISQVESHLKNPATLALLEKNRQSQSEQLLKLLSVISIVFGIGIFTTLGLVIKRLYDSGGTSINFFKPLSKNLCEDVLHITSQCNTNI